MLSKMTIIIHDNMSLFTLTNRDTAKEMIIDWLSWMCDSVTPILYKWLSIILKNWSRKSSCRVMLAEHRLLYGVATNTTFSKIDFFSLKYLNKIDTDYLIWYIRYVWWLPPWLLLVHSDENIFVANCANNLSRCSCTH